jgi:uncharacterized protein (TIGR00290 family)
MAKEKIILSWSGGKDCSYTLYTLQQEGKYEVAYLLSTFNGNLKRLSMHGVAEDLIDAQATSIGIPLLKVYVYEANNVEYEKQMQAVLLQAKAEGIHKVAFGDIFLEDLKQYRINNMQQIGMECIFPIWQQPTKALVQQFVATGFKTITCCINDGYLDNTWCGKIIDNNFIHELPNTVDYCGENGEFHTFCYDGPIFSYAIPITIGDLVYKPLQVPISTHPTPIKDVGTKGFWFSELLLA